MRERFDLFHSEQKFANPELILMCQNHAAISLGRSAGAVDVDPVSAEVGQHTASILEAQNAMRLRQMPLGIRQYPVVALAATDR